MGEAWSEDKVQWSEMYTRSCLKGFNHNWLISVDIVTDSKDPHKRILKIDQPKLGLERDYLIKGPDDKDVKAYFQYMVDTAIFLGADKDTANQEMQKVLDFELKVAEISVPKEDRRDKNALYNPMTAKEVINRYPNLPLVKFFIDKVLKLEDNEVINVAEPKFLDDLHQLLAVTPARTIANLIMWRNVKASNEYLTEEAQKIRLSFDKVINGQESVLPRWDKCVQSVAGLPNFEFYEYEGSLTNAVGSMYAKTYFPVEVKKVADEMVDNISDEFKTTLDSLNWMDDATKTQAYKKLDKMTTHSLCKGDPG